MNHYINRAVYLFLLLLCLSTVQAKPLPIPVQDSIATEALVFEPLESDALLEETVVDTLSMQRASTEKSDQQLSLIKIFLGGFLGGFAALLLPCIFPMLPLTVSFFTKRHKSRKQGILDAILYGLSIIVIYVGLGIAITIIFGADALNALSTNGIFNFAFFLMLVAFAASFFGAYEIRLPYKWTNKAEEKSQKKGFIGIFFMAAALSLVSFSCTGPIIGTLLVQAATSGARLGPAVGMFGFSLALALPFFLFALFPSWLSSLPKSGGWLNSVKVMLGFLELGLSLKFLSNVDLIYRWRILDREVFLALWIVIALMAGFYVLGKIKFAHDSEVKHVSLSRLFISIVIFSFSLYLVPGLWGAPLKSLSAFLPPQSTQDFDLYTPFLSSDGNFTLTDVGAEKEHVVSRKHDQLFHKPLNLEPFFDYEEGVAYAQKVNKPILLDFTGHACVNCRKMEAAVWPDKKVLGLIRNDYILIQLYVDDRTKLPEQEQYVSPFSNRKITSIGELNSDIQATDFNANAQPYYVLLNPTTRKPILTPRGTDYNPESYAAYLALGLKTFTNQ